MSQTRPEMTEEAAKPEDPVDIELISMFDNKAYAKARTTRRAISDVIPRLKELQEDDDLPKYHRESIGTGMRVARWLLAATGAGFNGFLPLTAATGLAHDSSEVVAPMLWSPDGIWLYWYECLPRGEIASRADDLEILSNELDMPMLHLLSGIVRFAANHHLRSERVLPLNEAERTAVSEYESDRCFPNLVWPCEN